MAIKGHGIFAEELRGAVVVRSGYWRAGLSFLLSSEALMKAYGFVYEDIHAMTYKKQLLVIFLHTLSALVLPSDK